MKKITLCAMLAIALLLTACSTVKTAPIAVSIKSVTFADSLNANFQAVNPKTQFKSTDTIHVSVNVSGRPTTGNLNGKFYYGDQLVSEKTLDFATANTSLLFSVGEDTFVGFSLIPSNPWPVGSGYHFDLYVNGAKVGSYPYEAIQ
jgi:uncharacterized protein YcfL